MRNCILFTLLIFTASTHAQNLISGGHLKPEQAIMDIRHYTLALDVNVDSQTISGSTEINLLLKETSPVILLNLVDLMKVDKVTVNGKRQIFTHKDHLLRIENSTPFAAGKTIVKVTYGGKPGVAVRPPWDGGFTWTKDSTGHPWVAITTEGEGGTILFPCKDHPSDEPDEGADMMIAVPKGLVVAGPGLLQSVKTKGNKSTYHWKTNYTINNYSILFNIGNYKVVSRMHTNMNGTKIPMQFYVLEEHADKAAHLLEMMERTVTIDEKYFGEYPWAKEKIALAETPHLGMEHQTMNAYGNRFRYSKLGGEDFDWLMHHEFGHEWWGNKITVKDWAHYWIQEGICTFGDALIVKEMEGEESYQKRMRSTARNFKNDKPVVLAEIGLTEDEAYTPDIYGKGAFFMHTLRHVMGDSVFFPTLKGFATDPRYTYDSLVTTDDVQNYFSKAAGKELKPLFDLFLRTTNHLEIVVKQTAEDSYKIILKNIDMDLPLTVSTSSGEETILAGKKEVIVKSLSLPVVDKEGYYFKSVVYE
jgi:aminopeptidase N